jgi:putative hydrolase of HD superfamily
MGLEQFYSSVIRLKELFRQGWIGKVPSSEIESVADHSYGVALLALVLVNIENEFRLARNNKAKPLNKLEILEKALVHDLPESQYLDLDHSFKTLLSAEQYKSFKTLLDKQAEQKILSNIKQVVEYNTNLPSMNLMYNSEEEEFVRVLDSIELLLQTRNYIKKGFISKENAQSFLDGTRTKIINVFDKFESFKIIFDFLFDDK